MEWGNFFDQAPETAAAVPVAAMRASARAPKVFPTAPPSRPSMALFAPPQQPPERPPQIEMPDLSKGQNNEWGDLTKQAVGTVEDLFGEKKEKPDSFSDTMKRFDEQLAAMRADRAKMSEELAALNKPGASGSMAGSKTSGYGPGSSAQGNEGFGYNVGNLRVSNAGWAGKGQPFNGFETFDTPQAGASAMFNNLKSYANAAPAMTVAAAIAKWAPPSENNTNSYIATVSKASGLPPDAPLSQVLANPEAAAKLMHAMARVEKGSGLHTAFTPELFKSVAGGTPAQETRTAETGYDRGGRVRYLLSLLGE